VLIQPHPDDNRKVRELFEHARKAEGPNEPRKHHFVPASYLRRWQHDELIRVTDLGVKTYTTSPERAARQTDFYRIEHPEIDRDEVPPLVFETMLGKLESSAWTAIDILIDGRSCDLDDVIHQEFAWHLAFQITRGHAFREDGRYHTASMYRLQYADITDEQIHRRLGKKGGSVTPELVQRHREFLDRVKTGESEFRPHDIELIKQAGVAAKAIVGCLLARWWYVFETPPILVTCDEPVIMLGGPGTPRDRRGGVANAGAILHPLSPSRLLVMFHPALEPRGPLALDGLETLDINREILANTHRLAFDQPQRRFTEKMPVPPPPELPLLPVGPIPWPNQEQGDLYMLAKRTRWASVKSPPPWPVERWWDRPMGTFALPPVGLQK
jgi:hypothetical protein